MRVCAGEDAVGRALASLRFRWRLELTRRVDKGCGRSLNALASKGPWLR